MVPGRLFARWLWPTRLVAPDRGGVSGSLGGERLQKVLAGAGIGSRRQCELLIEEGRVEVDRRVVTELGRRVDPTQEEIRVDGAPLPRPKRVYYLLNKPAGVVSTHRDPSGRPRVIDLVGGDERLFPVGRLDKSSEGLMLLTNDGALAHRLTHPRYGVAKRYLVWVAGRPGRDKLAQLRRGVRLAEGRVRAASVKVKRHRGRSTELEIVLREGRNREIRRMLARIGHKVVRLKRVGLGPLRLGRLPRGQFRPLTREEVELLGRCVQTEGMTAGRRRGRVRSVEGGGGAGRPSGKSSRRGSNRRSGGRGRS